MDRRHRGLAAGSHGRSGARVRPDADRAAESPRGGGAGPQPQTRGEDAAPLQRTLDASSYLSKLDFVDADRIALAGFYFPPPAGPQRSGIEFLKPDTDRPLLVLMGGADNETPPADCLPRLTALKDQGVPVEWDRSELNGNTKKDWRGETITYRYSKEATADSTRRAFEFLAKRLTK
jgi:hypothetical protein